MFNVAHKLGIHRIEGKIFEGVTQADENKFVADFKQKVPNDISPKELLLLVSAWEKQNDIIRLEHMQLLFDKATRFELDGGKLPEKYLDKILKSITIYKTRVSETLNLAEFAESTEDDQYQDGQTESNESGSEQA
jgi:hypothetical protein